MVSKKVVEIQNLALSNIEFKTLRILVSQKNNLFIGSDDDSFYFKFYLKELIKKERRYDGGRYFTKYGGPLSSIFKDSGNAARTLKSLSEKGFLVRERERYIDSMGNGRTRPFWEMRYSNEFANKIFNEFYYRGDPYILLDSNFLARNRSISTVPIVSVINFLEPNKRYNRDYILKLALEFVTPPSLVKAILGGTMWKFERDINGTKLVKEFDLSIPETLYSFSVFDFTICKNQVWKEKLKRQIMWLKKQRTGKRFNPYTNRIVKVDGNYLFVKELRGKTRTPGIIFDFGDKVKELELKEVKIG